MVEVMKIMAPPSKGSFWSSGTAELSAPDAAAGHCWPTPPPETPGYSRQVWVNLLWGHSSILLGPGVHKVLFCPPRVFLQSCVSSGSSMVWLMATSSKRAHAVPRSAAPRAPAPAAVHCWPIPPQRHSNTVPSQSLWGLWVLVSIRFEPSEHLWWVWGLILNGILPLLQSCWGFSFALGCGVSPKMEKLYTVSKNKTGSWLWLNHEFLIAKFRVNLNKVRKTTGPFRYDLNQIPYDYTVEVRNRFKGLVLIDRVPEELWMEVRDIVQEARIKIIPKKKKCKKAKCLCEEALQNSREKKRSDRQRRKGKIHPFECRIPKNSEEK